MSTILYESDNMTIIGHKYFSEQNNVYSSPDHIVTSSGSTGGCDAVHFDITMLVNGKLKSLGWNFLVERNNENGFEYSLKDWNDMYTISIILSTLGYRICTEQKDLAGLVRLWLKKIMN